MPEASYQAAAADYARAILAMLPQGLAWPRDDDSRLAQAARAMGQVLQRHHARALTLADESWPPLALELLSDWERVAGLPDPCTGPLETVAQRRNALVARLTARGGQSRAYFIGLAADLGYQIGITEFRLHNCEMDCEAPIYDEAWLFTWRVDAPAVTVIDSTCESPCEEPLRVWGNTLLECRIRAHAPAHTNVLFGYQE